MQVCSQLTSPAWQFREHVPLEHTWPGAHAVPALVFMQSPEAPQCRRLLLGSMHVELQLRSPFWQESWQTPFEHTCPALQTVPAAGPAQVPVAPQCSRLFTGSTHAPPQLTSPCWHDKEHTPLEQTRPAEHTVPELGPVQSPEAPQKRRLLLGSMHVEPQLMSPFWHESWQTPFEHTCPAPQTVPAPASAQAPVAPQYCRLLAGSTHAPPQLMSPC